MEGDLVVEPVVGVGVGVGDVVGFGVLGSVGVAGDGEGEVGSDIKSFYTYGDDGIWNGDVG